MTVPVPGDVREVLRAAFVEALEPSVPRDPPMSRKIAERWAARLLGLPAVRDALAAQETVRRVEALADELGGEAVMLPVMERAHASLRIYAALRGDA